MIKLSIIKYKILTKCCFDIDVGVPFTCFHSKMVQADPLAKEAQVPT